MINLYAAINESGRFPKMEAGELLFVEYTCMREETKLGFWSDRNYFAFIASGRKIWRTVHHSYDVNQGDILFIKKGANLTHQFFDQEFCAIFIFIPDKFIRAFVQKHDIGTNVLSPERLASQDAVLRVEPDPLLDNYYKSIRSYMSLPERPPDKLLILKFEELLLSLCLQDRHQVLADYFRSLCRDGEFHMNSIMEANFSYNLSLKDYARLCHMSLSTFKKVFNERYGTTPASWLKARKLDLAHQKIVSTAQSIQTISLECGFEDPSHFIRSFKTRYGLTPLQYRQSGYATPLAEN